MLMSLHIWISWALFAAVPAHDFHYSRTDLRWNPESSTWQVEIRVFTDDLELALMPQQADKPLNLGDDLEAEGVDASIENWTHNHCNMTANDKRIALKYLGKEVDYDITYLFLESGMEAPPQTLVLEWRLLFDEFEDQINEVALEFQGMNMRELFSAESDVHQLLP